MEYILFSSFPQGKFIRINFDVTGYIVGANIETCILSLWVFFRLGKGIFFETAVLLGLYKDISHLIMTFYTVWDVSFSFSSALLGCVYIL